MVNGGGEGGGRGALKLMFEVGHLVSSDITWGPITFHTIDINAKPDLEPLYLFGPFLFVSFSAGGARLLF